MKKLVALLCAAFFFILPMTALASGATTPTRVPDIGEAVTAYTKDDYILNVSAIKFSVMNANGAEQNGGLSGLENVMKIWLHTADNQSFTAYCLDMTEHYPPTIAASQESMISQFPQNYTTTAWPAGVNYDKMLWVVEHAYPAVPMDTMMSDAGASFSRLVSEIQTAQSLSTGEAETLAESVVYATIQQAIWHHQPALIKDTDGLYVGARMLNGNQDLQLLYSYLTKERAEYNNYRNASIGNSISISHPADMTPTQDGGAYVFGPFTIGTDMLSTGDVQLTQSGGGALTVAFTDASGSALSSVRQGEPFYVRASDTPTEPITITVRADTANAVTMDANRGRMYVPTDGSDVQPVGTGGVAHTTSATASLTLPTLNPPTPPVETGETVTFKKTDEATGAALQGAVIRIDDLAGKKVWQGETDASGLAVTDVELLYDADYTYYEVSAPTGYDLDSTRRTLRISRDGGNPEYWGVTNRLTVIEIPPVLTDVTLKKTDATTGEGLAGAKLKVTEASGTAIGVFTTGEDGTVTVPDLKPGSYQFSETEAPTGYSINKTAQSFAISDAGVVSGNTTISNEKIKPSVTLKKVDEQGKPLAGATIKVLDAGKKEVFSGKTDADGKVIVNGLSLL